jgi:hypothetical protein
MPQQLVNRGCVGGFVDRYQFDLRAGHVVLTLRTPMKPADGEKSIGDECRAVRLPLPFGEKLKVLTDGYKALTNDDQWLNIGVQLWLNPLSTAGVPELLGPPPTQIDLPSSRLFAVLPNRVEVEGLVETVDEQTGIVVMRHEGMDVRISLPAGAEVSQNHRFQFVAGIPDLRAPDSTFTGLKVTPT